MPAGFRPSFVPYREETQGHILAKRHIPNPPPSRVTEPDSELIDHTLYTNFHNNRLAIEPQSPT
jgi:hypothetical protein